jgi:hypothetical protein
LVHEEICGEEMTEEDKEIKAHKDLTVEERLDILEEQSMTLMLMVLQLAQGIAELSELFVKHVESGRAKKEMYS